MSQSSSDQLKLIGAGSVLTRLAFLVLTLVVFFASWRAAHWYMGSEIALAAPQVAEGALAAAETATRLSPDDPLAHWSLGMLEQRNISPEGLQAAIFEFEKAASLSPLDFRLWVDLGRALEQSGDYTHSEKALRRATELAPYYSWPRWHMGNFLVRRGRYDEGFGELRMVAESDPSKRGPVFDLAWIVYGGDAKTVRSKLGDSPSVRAEFVSYLLSRSRLDEALQLWSSFSSAEKKEGASTGKMVVDNLIAAKRYRAALSLSRDQMEGKPKPEVGKISNGSFENAVAQNSAVLFDWNVPSIPQAQAALDPGNPHDGSLSLRITFNAPQTIDFNVTQLTAVEPATSYRLLFYVRASSLKSAAMPVVQVLAPDGKALAVSAPVTPDKSDWQQVAVDFKTPPDVDGITVRITRASCTAEGAVCPIFGTVWYDDFNLQLVGRDAGTNGARRAN